eukprot:COSAG04_NODE_216_length_19953_cov_85.343558_19_plen_121_part_00
MAAKSHLIVLLGAHLSRPAAASAEAGRLRSYYDTTITLQPRFWHASWGAELAFGAARAAGGRRGPWGKGEAAHEPYEYQGVFLSRDQKVFVKNRLNIIGTPPNAAPHPSLSLLLTHSDAG